MAKDFVIYVVDDNQFARRTLESAFKTEYTVEAFASADECLARLREATPNLFLLDVDMPGTDGYAFCRQIKRQETFERIPVIFVSGQDDIESRVRGFEVGGYDFIVKPFSLVELKQKVEHAHRVAAERHDLQQRTEESELLASLVLSSLDEYAVLVRFLRALNSCRDHLAVGQSLFDLLHAYRLNGALQFRLTSGEVTQNASGEATPLEASIFSQIRSMGSVVQFKNRAAYNYDRVSLLVNDMPVEDAELCGRLRDHLAIAAESADAKLAAIGLRLESERTKREIVELSRSVGEALARFKEDYKAARYRGTLAGEQIVDALSTMLSSLALSDRMESALTETVRDGADEIAGIYDFGEVTEKALSDLTSRLEKMLAAP